MTRCELWYVSSSEAERFRWSGSQANRGPGERSLLVAEAPKCRSVVQNDVDQRTIDKHPGRAVVDVAKIAKPIQEETHA